MIWLVTSIFNYGDLPLPENGWATFMRWMLLPYDQVTNRDDVRLGVMFTWIVAYTAVNIVCYAYGHWQMYRIRKNAL